MSYHKCTTTQKLWAIIGTCHKNLILAPKSLLTQYCDLSPCGGHVVCMFAIHKNLEIFVNVCMENNLLSELLPPSLFTNGHTNKKLWGIIKPRLKNLTLVPKKFDSCLWPLTLWWSSTSQKISTTNVWWQIVLPSTSYEPQSKCSLKS